MKKEKKLIYIIHWQYHKHGSSYGASHNYINTKEIIECESVTHLKKTIREILILRKLKKNDIKSIKLVLKDRKVKLSL